MPKFYKPRDFKYDVVELIRCVELRPCLWDKTLENYKDRVERRHAWEEIFASLDEKYESMTPEEKRITGEHILNKWTNIRDTFVKSLKVKMGKPKKRYLLYKNLSFLLKVIDIPEEEVNTNFTQESSDESNEVPVSFLKQEQEESYTPRKRKKVDYNEEYVVPTKEPEKSYDNGIDFVEVEDNETRVMNEDEAFFASLLPTVVKYSEDERLEFRIEVLGVMKKIKDKRNWSDQI
ncbi:uncharacterized protein LOC134751436 [Cydia strobilella]|uniref:uncharacterized protein LOC134751436 n=1 Tax=Cydia strobilella TaxID=1100964 RepID=UPI003007DC18